MAVLSDLAAWRPLLIGVVIAVLIFGRFRARACVVTIFIVLLIVEQMTGTLKKAVDRKRPKQAQEVRMVELQKARPKILTVFKKPIIRYSDASDRNRSGPSFPSGHMANNSAIALCCTFFYRKRGWIYWIVAGLVGYSRIYLGAHWPSDIAATLFLAVGETLLIIGLMELIWRTAVRRWAPDFFSRHPSLIATQSK